jgi:hypothetical protein
MKAKYLQPEVSDASEVLHLKLWEGSVFDYSLSGYVATPSGGTGTPISEPPAFRFNATNTQYLDIGACYNGVKTISLWIKQDDISGNEYPIDLNGTDYIAVESGVVTVYGLAGHILYVDGVVGTSGVTTIDTQWHLITVTDTTANNASDCDIGRVTAAYYDGLISDVRLNSVVRTPSQIKDFYEQTRWRYSV